MPTILTLPEAQNFLGRVDDDPKADGLLRDIVLPGVDEIVEQYAGWVVPRELTFTIEAGQRSVVLPGHRFRGIVSAAVGSEPVDVTGWVIDDAGILRTDGGRACPSMRWTLTALVGMDPIPQAIKNAAGEILLLAWEHQTNPTGDLRPFLVPYRAEAWLAPFTNGATVA